MQVQFLPYGQTGNLGGEVKRSNIMEFHSRSISKIFIPNIACGLTNKRHHTYRSEFLFCDLGHALRLGIGST